MDLSIHAGGRTLSGRHAGQATDKRAEPRNRRSVCVRSGPERACLRPDRAFAHLLESVSAASFQIDIPDLVLARARRGDARALETIYRAFERPAYTLALRMIGDAESAREVVHDAMLRLIERIGQFRGDAPFWGWLRQILVNEALMRLRKSRGASFDVLDERDEPPGEEPPPWLLADATQLERALGKLPSMTRSVLWLYHVEEYTHQEIAQMTGKSVSFSKSQVARGAVRLRRLLDTQKKETVPCLTATV
jgi:RNA polymerase sigma-70 factor (ECF subfamily)